MFFSEGFYLLSDLVDPSSCWGRRLSISLHLVHYSILVLLEKADASVSSPELLQPTCAGSASASAASFE